MPSLSPESSSHDATRALQKARVPPRAPGDVAILIPAYQPPDAVEDLIYGLLGEGAPAILLIDDGSPGADQPRFERLAQEPCVHLLQHQANLGKGIALKTGFDYFLEYLPHYAGLVTADADGQHAADDVLRAARALHASPEMVILGARSLVANADVPLRSRVGNWLTAMLFRVMTDIPVSDALTGLRALPTPLLRSLLQLPGRRYEYEMAALAYIARTGHPLAEQSIRTLYEPGDETSHFRPIVDSWRILNAMFRRPTLVPAPPPWTEKAKASSARHAVAGRSGRAQ